MTKTTTLFTIHFCTNRFSPIWHVCTHATQKISSITLTSDNPSAPSYYTFLQPPLVFLKFSTPFFIFLQTEYTDSYLFTKGIYIYDISDMCNSQSASQSVVSSQERMKKERQRLVVCGCAMVDSNDIIRAGMKNESCNGVKRIKEGLWVSKNFLCDTLTWTHTHTHTQEL